MRIGELARRTGVSARMLRYYEQQELLHPRRDPNDYREYDESDVGRVEQISHLVRAGLGTRFVRTALDVGPGWSPSCTAVLAQELQDELDRLEDFLACLTRSRDTVRRYLEELPTSRATGTVSRPSASPTG